MESVFRDLRYGLRMLIKNPGFTAVAVITMALGLGANTALFSVVNGVMLNALPFRDPDRLMFVLETNAKFPAPGVVASALNYNDWKQQNRSFESMGARQAFAANLTSAERPEKIQGEKVTWDYFPTLGVVPIRGRALTQDEDQVGGKPVILLSQGLWERRFAASPELIGKTIPINGQSLTVIGIMPNDYRPNIEFWTPLGISFQGGDRNLHSLQVVGRLAPGVSQQQAQTELSAIATQLASQYPEANAGWGVAIIPFLDLVILNVRQGLMILLGAVGFVLLIACANVANLMLSRAASREREIGVRLALGATRVRLIRQMLTESLLISVIGGLVGVLIAVWGTDLLLSLNPQGIPRAKEIGIDGRVLGFALAVSLISGLVFGLTPAWLSSKPNLNETLKESGRSSSANARGARLRNVLVVVQVALAFVLLVGAGLLIKSFAGLQRVDVGFNRENLLAVQVSLPAAQYPQPPSVVGFYTESFRRLAAIPGVESVGAISQAPMAGTGPQFVFSVEGKPLPTPAEAPIAAYRIVTPRYFETLSIPIVKGRSFNETDKREGLQTVVINQNLAKAMWPGEDPVGRRMTVGVPLPGEVPDWVTVVGVAGNVKHISLSGETGMQMYQSVEQTPFPGSARSMTFMIRSSVDPMTLTEPVRRVFSSIDATLPLSNVKAMTTIIGDSLAPVRFNMFLLGVFAAVAMTLTMVGVYGVMSYAVTQRTQEMGVRMALGAQPGQVRMLILKHGLKLAGLGLLAGLIGSAFVVQIMTNLLFGVAALDPVVLLLVAAGLAVLTVLACYIPARRATRIDPMVALRYE